MSRPIQFPVEKAKIHTFLLGGGENRAAGAFEIAEGELIYSLNYEPAEGAGYRRIDGYERYDGRPKPSEGHHTYIPFSNGIVEPSDGIRIVGTTSTAQGDLYGYVLESGSWAGGDAAGYLIILNPTRDFAASETVSFYEPPFDSGFSEGFE